MRVYERMYTTLLNGVLESSECAFTSENQASFTSIMSIENSDKRGRRNLYFQREHPNKALNRSSKQRHKRVHKQRHNPVRKGGRLYI